MALWGCGSSGIDDDNDYYNTVEALEWLTKSLSICMDERASGCIERAASEANPNPVTTRSSEQLQLNFTTQQPPTDTTNLHKMTTPSQDTLKTLEQSRQRLIQLTHSLGSLITSLNTNDPLPSW